MATYRERKAWVITVSAFICVFLTSVPYASGIIYLGILEKYKTSVTLTTWLVSLFHSAFYFAAPFAGFIVNTISCRGCVIAGGLLTVSGFTLSAIFSDFYFLYFSFAVIAGSGYALIFFASNVVLGYYFDKHRTLATGLASSGSAVGIVIYPPLIQYLNDVYGLDGMFMLIGAIGFHACIFGAILKPNRLELETQHAIATEKRESRTNSLYSKLCTFISNVQKYFQLFRNLGMVMFCMSAMAGSSAVNTCVVYLPDYYHTFGSSKIEASLLMSLFGFGSGVSRILMGMASVKDGVDPKILYFGSYGVIGILTFFLSVMVKTFAGKLIYSVSLGLYTGGTVALMSQISIDVVGFKNFASGMGLMLFSGGVGTIVGPVSASVILGKFGFDGVLYYTSILFVCASICGLVMIAGIPGDIETDPMFNRSNFEKLSHPNQLEGLCTQDGGSIT